MTKSGKEDVLDSAVPVYRPSDCLGLATGQQGTQVMINTLDIVNLLAKTEASQELQEINDMLWKAKLTFYGWGRNPFFPDVYSLLARMPGNS